MAVFNITLLEIIVLQMGAIILGIAIHFFITSRRSLDITPDRKRKLQKQFEDWKLKFYNEAELKEKELAELRHQLLVATENSRKYKSELDELSQSKQDLQHEYSQQDFADDLAIKDEEIGILHQKLKNANENNRQLQNRVDELQENITQLNEQANEQPVAIKNNSDEELQSLKEKVGEYNEANKALSRKLEQLNKEKQDLQFQIQELQSKEAIEPVGKGDYLGRLLEAQINLQEQNQRLSQIIEQVDAVKENEMKQQEISRENETLSVKLEELQQIINEKENEINSLKEKEQLSVEMHSMLNNAYAEFNTMQAKIKKLESEIALSKMANLEFEDLKEANQKLMRDFEHQRARLFAQVSENQKLNARVNDLENNLSELNFHRQQLQKRILYLEELNNDMHTLSEANKNLENRLKSIGELESRLNLVSEERDDLLRNKEKE